MNRKLQIPYYMPDKSRKESIGLGIMSIRGPGSIPTRGNIFITLIYTILPDMTEQGLRRKTGLFYCD